MAPKPPGIWIEQQQMHAEARRRYERNPAPIRGLRAMAAFFYFLKHIAVVQLVTYPWRMLAVAQGAEVRHG